MKQEFTQPKNTEIKISELGDESKFVCGYKKWQLEFADYRGNRFEPGVTVSWTDKDERKAYKGKIEWIILVDTGEVEVSIDNDELGRLPLDELRLIKKAPRNKTGV